MQPYSIAILGKKISVGKTTFSLCIAHCLASFGHHVLLVDCDPEKQGLTAWHSRSSEGYIQKAPHSLFTYYYDSHSLNPSSKISNAILLIPMQNKGNEFDKQKNSNQTLFENVIAIANNSNLSFVIFDCGKVSRACPLIGHTANNCNTRYIVHRPDDTAANISGIRKKETHHVSFPRAEETARILSERKIPDVDTFNHDILAFLADLFTRTLPRPHGNNSYAIERSSMAVHVLRKTEIMASKASDRAKHQKQLLMGCIALCAILAFLCMTMPPPLPWIGALCTALFLLAIAIVFLYFRPAWKDKHTYALKTLDSLKIAAAEQAKRKKQNR